MYCTCTCKQQFLCPQSVCTQFVSGCGQIFRKQVIYTKLCGNVCIFETTKICLQENILECIHKTNKENTGTLLIQITLILNNVTDMC